MELPPSVEQRIETIKDTKQWQETLELFSPPPAPTCPETLKFLLIGTPTSGKSSLVNTLYRSFNPTKINWQIVKNQALESQGQSTLALDRRLLIADFDHIEMIDTIGLNDLQSDTLSVWYRILFGQEINAEHLSKLTKLQPDEILDQFKVSFKEIFQPNGVIFCVPSNCENISLVCRFIRILSAAGLGVVIVITKIDNIENVDNLTEIENSLKEVRHEDLIFRMASYTSKNDKFDNDKQLKCVSIMEKLIHSTLLGLHRPREYSESTEKSLSKPQ